MRSKIQLARSVALAGPSILCLVGTAHAQQLAAVGVPEQVTITGRLEEDLPARLAELGTRVDTVSAVEIQNGGYVDVAQSLQTLVPGLYISPRSGPFDYVDISLQGSRTADVLWTVDGVRINNRLYGGTTPLDLTYVIPAQERKKDVVLSANSVMTMQRGE